MSLRQKGFTIVELIVVISVIAILASITIVAYNGVQKRAQDASIETDLKNISAAISRYRAVKGTYPTTTTEIGDMGNTSTTGVSSASVKVSRGAYDVLSPAGPSDTYSRNLLICVRSGGSDPAFGVAAYSKSGNVWFYTSTSGLKQSPDPWIGQQTTTCPRLGIATTDPGYARWFGYEHLLSDSNTDSGWKNWAAN
jgi:prepilin-type N-terminal cleavage/methylation domain-containing protein